MTKNELTHCAAELYGDWSRSSNVESNGAWAFAPIGVVATLERDAIGLSQMIAFGKAFNLPVIRWRRELVALDMLGFEDSEVDRLFEDEAHRLYDYFIEGMPMHILSTINSVRGLPNGAMALAYSLQWEGDLVPAPVAAARGFEIITVDVRPAAFWVRVGSTKTRPYTWHGIPLPDLASRIGLAPNDDQIVPIRRAHARAACRSSLLLVCASRARSRRERSAAEADSRLAPSQVGVQGERRVSAAWNGRRAAQPGGQGRGEVVHGAAGVHAHRLQAARALTLAAHPQHLQAPVRPLYDDRVALRARVAAARVGGRPPAHGG